MSKMTINEVLSHSCEELSDQELLGIYGGSGGGGSSNGDQWAAGSNGTSGNGWGTAGGGDSGVGKCMSAAIDGWPNVPIMMWNCLKSIF